METGFQNMRSEFSLVIRGSMLDFSAIEKSLDLHATRTSREGDILHQLPLLKAQSDIWAYTIPLTVPEGVDEAFQSLLQHIEQRKTQLEEIARRHQITFRLSVQSFSAQIAYRLMPSTLSRLSALGYPLDLSSVSFGDFGGL